MGFISDLRTSKRAAKGDPQRDAATIAAPALIILDADGGSIDDLRIAVVERLRMESEREDAYVREIHQELNRTEHGQLVLVASNMASKAVITGDWRPLADFAGRRAPDHWLVREVAPAA